MTHPDTPTSGAPTTPAPVLRGGRRAPRRTRAEAKRLDELRGGDHAGPKLAELLAAGEWQPEFLLVQRIGPLVDYRKAGERALNKYIANRRGRMPDELAKAEATAQYHGNPEKARRYGQKLIVLQLLSARQYESRLIAEGRYAGEREWRLLPPALRKRRRPAAPAPSSPPTPAAAAAERMVQAWADTAAAARAAGGDVISAAELDRLVAADEQGGYKAVRVLARKLGIKEKPAQDAVRVAKAQRPGGVNDAWVPGYQRKNGSWVKGHWARRHHARFPGADAAALALGDALDAGTYDAVLPQLVARATARLAFLEARRRANGVSSPHEPDSAPQDAQAPAQEAPPPAALTLTTPRNKAKDLLPDELAAVHGWLGQGYRFPEGPPYPWELLLPNELALFEQAVRRLTLADVPERVAQALCWAEGNWHVMVPKIITAQNVQAYPERKHIRLVPRPTIQHILGLPAVTPVVLPPVTTMAPPPPED